MDDCVGYGWQKLKTKQNKKTKVRDALSVSDTEHKMVYFGEMVNARESHTRTCHTISILYDFKCQN